MLIQDMLKYTVEGHPDASNLQVALKIVRELADFINASKDDADEHNRLNLIQERITGAPQVKFLEKQS
jgi:hypothetical protein